MVVPTVQSDGHGSRESRSRLVQPLCCQESCSKSRVKALERKEVSNALMLSGKLFQELGIEDVSKGWCSHYVVRKVVPRVGLN